MNRVFDDGKDYDWARDDMYDPEPDWSDRDERILQEIWEMDMERAKTKPRWKNGSV